MERAAREKKTWKEGDGIMLDGRQGERKRDGSGKGRERKKGVGRQQRGGEGGRERPTDDGA